MAGLLSAIGKFFGNKSDKDIKEIKPKIEKINEEYSKLNSLTHDELRNKTNLFKSRIQDAVKKEKNDIEALKEKAETAEISNENIEDIYKEIDEKEELVLSIIEDTLNEILPEAFAVIKETARRFKEEDFLVVKASDYDRQLAVKKDFISISETSAKYQTNWDAAGVDVAWDMVHYDVQLIGGIVLHDGKIAEMQTGEGKTLSATLPIYLNALSGLGVHLVTVNDYLARRDSEWMGPIFQFHGLSVECIDNYQPNSQERRDAYMADITYGTNNEFGFDYLRDNMAKREGDLVQRKLHYSIVDEVDSVLIDDARTPLIISGPTPKGDQHEYNDYKHQVERLFSEQKKYVTTVLSDAKKLINEGKKDEGGFNLLRAFRGLPRNKALIKYLSEEGVKTQLQKTENYYMQDQNKEMHIVDEELFFVIDEKSNSIETLSFYLNKA